jgi:hypothetical protein
MTVFIKKLLISALGVRHSFNRGKACGFDCGISADQQTQKKDDKIGG